MIAIDEEEAGREEGVGEEEEEEEEEQVGYTKPKKLQIPLDPRWAA
jgi:hypothetical protein